MKIIGEPYGKIVKEAAKVLDCMVEQEVKHGRA